MSERPNRNCETCGSPVPACYALCFVCLADALNARLTELQDRVDNGFQGGCWCCESVATKNIELNAALERSDFRHPDTAIYPLEEIAAAHQQVERGANAKVLIKL